MWENFSGYIILKMITYHKYSHLSRSKEKKGQRDKKRSNIKDFKLKMNKFQTASQAIKPPTHQNLTADISKQLTFFLFGCFNVYEHP